MSRFVAGPRAVPATATAPPRPRQATPRQPVRAGVPVYLQRVAADSPARSRIAEQVQSQAQHADATTVQQASQAMAGLAGPAGASGSRAAGSGLGAGAAAATAASASGATAAPTPPVAGAAAGRTQAPGATTAAQAPGATTAEIGRAHV